MKRGGGQRRLADADDRDVGHGARRVEPGIVEAGDDRGVAPVAFALADLDAAGRARDSASS